MPDKTESKSHCMKCKKSVNVKDVKVVKTKNGRSMEQGICVNCGTKTCKFIKG